MISPMKKILLAAKTSDRQKVLDLLKASAAVHVEPADASQVAVPSSLLHEIDICLKAYNVLSQWSVDPENLPLAAPGTPKRVAEETLGVAAKIPELELKRLELVDEIKKTYAWGMFDPADIAWLKDNGLNVVFLQGDEAESSEIEAELVSKLHGTGKDSIWVLASRSQISWPESFAETTIPRATTSAMSDELDQVKRDIKELKERMYSLAMRRDDIERYRYKLLNRKRYSEVETGVLDADEVFVLTGWCPEAKTDELVNTFASERVAVGISFKDPAEDESPPTYLENCRFGQAIGPMYDFMGLTPSYTEPDISPLFLLTLCIFSGFLIADGGYGLLLFLPLAFGYKKLRKRGIDADILHLGLALSGGMVVYGVVTNVYFGEFLPPLASYQFRPDMIFIQGVCFLMGASHLTLAHIMKMRLQKVSIRLLSDVGWILFIWAMYILICNMIIGQDFVLAFSLFKPLLIAGLVLIMFFTKPSWNIFVSFGHGLAALAMNVSSYFSDILSYIRLWAVGLAGGQVAQAFNNIATMVPVFILRIPVYILGHGINIILGMIAILAHGVRLNLLEFSNHLDLEWAGRKYDPFKEIK